MSELKPECETCVMNTICTKYDKDEKKETGNCPYAEQPKCETCGGSEQVNEDELNVTEEVYDKLFPFSWVDGIRIFPCPECRKELLGCPDCAQQPKAGEFTKGLRQNVREFPDFPEHLRDLFEQDILKACDIIDRQDAQLTAANEEECETCVMNTICTKYDKDEKKETGNCPDYAEQQGHTDYDHKEWPYQIHARAKTHKELKEKVDCLMAGKGMEEMGFTPAEQPKAKTALNVEATIAGLNA
ncbi:unnamed protein product, partial [marine sediment metagenome]